MPGCISSDIKQCVHEECSGENRSSVCGSTGKCHFLPFMGIVLQDVYRKHLVKVDKMMPATQMVFLELLYMNDEESALKSEVANKLNLTKTSVTRATAQLEKMGLIEQLKSGTEIPLKGIIHAKSIMKRQKHI